MGILDRGADVAVKISAILAKFEDLEHNVERMAVRQDQLAERIAALEARMGTVGESAASEARAAAHAGVYKLQSELIERITRLEERFAHYEKRPTHPVDGHAGLIPPVAGARDTPGPHRS